MLLSRTLTDIGYDVCQAANGPEALSLLRRNAGVSLVLLDWNMPEMTGLEVVKEIRADPKYASVVLMMVTTEIQVEQMVRALTAGANEYVMKPFTKEIIADKLRLLGLIQ